MRAQVDQKLLDDKLAALEEARRWSPRVISKLEMMIHAGDDYELYMINPIRYAAEQGITEAESIDLFLYCAKQGLFEMVWHVICLSCGSVVESFRALSRLHTHFICRVCSSENVATLDDYIGVAFTISPQIRPIVYHQPQQLSIEDLYLKYHMSKELLDFPDGRSVRDILVEASKVRSFVEPHKKASFKIDCQPGFLQATNALDNASFGFAVEASAHSDPQHVKIQFRDGKFHIDKQKAQPLRMENEFFSAFIDTVSHLHAGEINIDLENMSDQKCAVWMIYIGPDFPFALSQFGPFLSGKKLVTHQTFRNLFRSETVSGDEGIGVKNIVFLFTDLKGSTEMYDRIGDLNAYEIVRQHFGTLTLVISRNNGSVVKTIGDAVMATFSKSTDALTAAIEMLQDIREFNRIIAGELILKIGIHQGPSILVTSNDKLDYFGQTVNIAARVQGLADANEIYLTDAVYKEPGVVQILDTCNVFPEPAKLKGISEKMDVYKLLVQLRRKPTA